MGCCFTIHDHPSEVSHNNDLNNWWNYEIDLLRNKVKSLFGKESQANVVETGPPSSNENPPTVTVFIDLPGGAPIPETIQRRIQAKSNPNIASQNSPRVCLEKPVWKPAKMETTFSEDDDEDVCPTCLEEYDEENPKIVAKCSHHFHLGCIYEWKERSNECPVCFKVMEFDEN